MKLDVLGPWYIVNFIADIYHSKYSLHNNNMEIITLTHGKSEGTTCEIYKYGATVTSWRVAGGENIIFVRYIWSNKYKYETSVITKLQIFWVNLYNVIFIKQKSQVRRDKSHPRRNSSLLPSIRAMGIRCTTRIC